MDCIFLKSGKQIQLSRCTKDVFTVPFKDGYILYIPEVGFVAAVNKRVHYLISSILKEEGIADNSYNRKWLEILSKLGVFAANEQTNLELAEFSPTYVTLSLSYRCNLKCVYCYARAGEEIRDMDEHVMNAALLLVADNTVRKGGKEFTVSFHGEGEPTANWSLFKKAIVISEELAEKRKLDVKFTMSTNAMWNKSQRSFIAEHFDDLSISFDGVPETQNQQRPTACGLQSFSTVFDNLKFLDSADIKYGIRATVLPNSIEKMVPFINFVSDKLKCRWVHFEPVFMTGRATGLGSSCKSRAFFLKFVVEYNKASLKGNELGFHIVYSGCRALENSNNFCHSTGGNPNFFVSTKGMVSSCYEIIDPLTPKGNYTVYGHYDRRKNCFQFYKEKLTRIRNMGVKDYAECRSCFARWNCSGDCFARSDFKLDENDRIVTKKTAPRCLANRETTLRELVRYAIAATLLKE